MKKVFIHIGHGKTGTSATQTALARSHIKLKEFGFCYPEHPSFKLALKGRISSGNIDGSRKEWFEEQLLPAVLHENSDHTFIFSNENIFWKIEKLFNAAPQLESEIKFHVILVVRDPFEMLSSAYIQAVKRSGYTGTVSEYSKNESHIIRAAHLVREMKAKNIDYSLINYSSLRRNVTGEIFKIIGIEKALDCNEMQNLETVNRSLSFSELKVIVLINQVFGRAAGSSVSNALVNTFPDIPSDSVHLPISDIHDFEKRVAESVEYLNLELTKANKIKLQPPAVDTLGSVPSLSVEQVEVIKESLCRTSLTEDDALFLYGAALTYEKGEALSINHSVKLLQLAARAKPQGPMIRDKLQEFTKKINS